MWGVVLRVFLWLSGGAVIGTLYGDTKSALDIDGTERSAPWWVLPAVVLTVVGSIFLFIWRRGRR